jgi:hypothetical protein
MRTHGLAGVGRDAPHTNTKKRKEMKSARRAATAAVALLLFAAAAAAKPHLKVKEALLARAVQVMAGMGSGGAGAERRGCRTCRANSRARTHANSCFALGKALPKPGGPARLQHPPRAGATAHLNRSLRGERGVASGGGVVRMRGTKKALRHAPTRATDRARPPARSITAHSLAPPPPPPLPHKNVANQGLNTNPLVVLDVPPTEFIYPPADDADATAGAAAKANKILVYITTHLSEQHNDFLEQCWPPLLSTLPLFQKSDFMIFATETEGVRVNETLVRSVFATHGITVHASPNPGYQGGAILALVEGFRNGWFQDYEWLVRVNPDVLIRNDTFLLSSMGNDGVNGIFVDCKDRQCPAGNKCTSRRIHTDFFAVRPKAVELEAVLNVGDFTNAESMATKIFSGIVKNGSDVWLPDTGPHKGHCRVVGQSSPVIHSHSYLRACGAVGVSVM